MIRFEECGLFTTAFFLIVFVFAAMFMGRRNNAEDKFERFMRIQGHIGVLTCLLFFLLPINTIHIGSNIRGNYEVFQSGYLFERTYYGEFNVNASKDVVISGHCLFNGDTFSYSYVVKEHIIVALGCGLILGYLEYYRENYNRKIYEWLFFIYIIPTFMYLFCINKVLEDSKQRKIEYGGGTEWSFTVNHGELSYVYRSLQIMSYQVVLAWIAFYL